MPVRIYDISKKLGLENKEVLSKAKELGLAAARVASSSLDKITAEYLEQQLIQAHPNLVAPRPTPQATPAPLDEGITLITLPRPQSETLQQHEPATATALLEPKVEPNGPAAQITAPQVEAGAPAAETPMSHPLLAPDSLAKAAPRSPPPPPPGPKVGDIVGFVQLPPKAVPKTLDKSGPAKLPLRPLDPRTTEFTKRGDIRSVRAPARPPAGTTLPGAMFPAQHRASGPGKAPATP